MTLNFQEEKQDKRLKELHSKEAEDLAQILSIKYDLPYIDLSKFAINTDALRLIEEPAARAAGVAAFKITGKNLFMVVTSPQNQATGHVIEELKNKGYVPQLYLGSEASLERAWGRYPEISYSARTETGVIDIVSSDIANWIEKVQNLEDLRARIEEEGGDKTDPNPTGRASNVSSALEIILAGAIATNASDIHLEPEAEHVRLRFRLDGVLNDITFFNQKLYTQLLSRLKLVSGLKLNIRHTAQDGRFSITLGKTDIEVRTSVLPGAYGESIVLRVLNPQSILVDFAALGIEPVLFAVVEREIKKPNGLILLTGPTGSGKTTSLYAFLRIINSPESKIITIEDPIEYHLAGVNQTQVDRSKDLPVGRQGYTFLTGLRSALRQDPDIIMVGEIRDAETAKIAVNASLTGHLVFSTLHTNNAAGTIPRLIDLGVNPKVIDAALNLAIAQRLVRKLCRVCKEAYSPEGDELKLLEGVRASILARRPGTPLSATGQIFRAKEGGCSECHGTGYRGREGVFEAIIINQQISKTLSADPNEREIRIAAKNQGLLEMRQDGVLKVLAGITSLAELGRVVDLTEEII